MNKRRLFRFGDRIDHTLSAIYPLQAGIKFVRFLVRQGFRGSEPIVRYFLYGGFHDGLISIDTIDSLTSTVVMTFDNITAMDCVYDTLGKKHRKVHVEDFITQVTFKGVVDFRLETPTPLKDPAYYQAEFWKEADHLKLVVYFENAGNYFKRGRISIVFESLQVEDISRKLSKYATEPKEVRSWLPKRHPSLKEDLAASQALLQRYRNR